MTGSAKPCHRDCRFTEIKGLTWFAETATEAHRIENTHIIVAKDKKLTKKGKKLAEKKGQQPTVDQSEPRA